MRKFRRNSKVAAVFDLVQRVLAAQRDGGAFLFRELRTQHQSPVIQPLADCGDAEFPRFCSIATGSASELQYHLLLAKDLKLVKPKDYSELSDRATELKRMLTALIQTLNAGR